MFPFEEDQFAPLERWYVAAWSDEVTRTPMQRWIADEPVAFYRKADGSPVAVESRCPHHFFPLEKSALEGDNIRCGYHGLQFAPDGRCVFSPFLAKIPSACRIKSYAVAERWKWIWIWPGDPAQADESLIPDHAEIGLANPDYTAIQGYWMEVQARYQLLNDNLLDLQHLEVLHSEHIGGDGLGRAEEKTESGVDWVNSHRVLRNFEMPPVMAEWFGPGFADRFIDMRFRVPGIHVGSDSFEGAAGSPRAGKHLGRINVYHAVTPGRRTTCHYFTAMGRDFMHNDAQFDEGMKHKLIVVLEQDRFAAEQVERLLSESNRRKEMLFRSDETLVIGRRLLARMMQQESAARMPAL